MLRKLFIAILIALSFTTKAGNIDLQTARKVAEGFIKTHNAAGTTIAVEAPRNIADAHLVLGHATPQTTQKHYIQAQSLQAGAKFQAAMLERLTENHTNPPKETR